MSAQVFRSAVHHQVKTMLDRPDQVRRCKRTIDNAHCTYLLRSGTDSIQVNDLDKGIGERFDIDDIRLLRTNNVSHIGTTQIMQDDLDTQGHKNFTQQTDR